MEQQIQQQNLQQNEGKKGKRSTLLLVLLLLLVTITVGYAVLSATLNISGSSTIKDAEWCVGPKCDEDQTGEKTCTNIETCDNPPIECASNEVCTIMDCDVNASAEKCTNPPAPDECTDPSKAGQSDCKGAIIWMKGDTVYFKHILSKPGDVFTFNVRYDNGGDIDAKVADVVKSDLNTTAQQFMNYTVTYADGSTIAANDTLAAGSSATFKVTVSYKDVATLPTAEQIALINETSQGHTGATSLFTVNYQQK